MKKRVLIVEKDPAQRDSFKSWIENAGLTPVCAVDGDSAIREYSDGEEFAVAVVGVDTPGRDGYSLLRTFKKEQPQVRVIFTTAAIDKSGLIQAVQQGVSGVFEKPFNKDEFTQSVKQNWEGATRDIENHKKVETLQAHVTRVQGTQEDKLWFVSKSTSMQKVNNWLSDLQKSSMQGQDPNTVLILGENGAGRSGIARMVHSSSTRGEGPWISVSCSDNSPEGMDSELFGHEKGAFPGATKRHYGVFEIASGGTVFLDQIELLDLRLQAKLLKVIDEKSFKRIGSNERVGFNVKLIVGGSDHLEELVKSGSFREDLYKKLMSYQVTLPPLKERREDILDMANRFCEREFVRWGRRFPGFTREAEGELRLYNWPGNIHELMALSEQLALSWKSEEPVPAGCFPFYKPAAQGPTPGLRVVDEGESGFTHQELSDGYTSLKKRWVDNFERRYLVATLKRHRGNVSAASREAKLDRSNFLRLLRRHSIKASEFRSAEQSLDESVRQVA